MNETLKEDLQSLKADLILYKASIKEVADEILAEGLSQYPIFIASRTAIPVGELILDHTELAMNWSINASTLEEFLEHKLVEFEKQSLFKSSYKDPKNFICIFLVSEGGASFVFVPYKSSPEG